MKKRAITFLLCIAMLASFGAVTALAATDVTITIKPESTEVAPGETASFTLEVSNPNKKPIEGIGFTLDYSTGLTYFSSANVSNKFMLRSANEKGVFFVIATNNGGSLSASGASGGVTDTNFTLCEINCQVASTVAVGTKLTLSVNSTKLEVFAHGNTPLTATLNSGTVTVKSASTSSGGLKGDINGDGKLTSKDTLLLKRAVAKLIVLTDKQRANADVNNDGKLTSKDTLLLKRAVAHLITLG